MSSTRQASFYRRKLETLNSLSELHVCFHGDSIELKSQYLQMRRRSAARNTLEVHISEVVGKVAKVLAALRRLRPICP